MAIIDGDAALVSGSTLTADALVTVKADVVLTASSSLTTGSIVTALSGVDLVADSTLVVDGAVITGILTTPFGENNDIQIPILLQGQMLPILPPPTPPVDFVGLLDPTVSPTLTKADTAGGHLLPGTYRYSYAAWKDSPGLPTAPSPTADITLTTEDTVTLTYPTIAGAAGYLVYREDL